MISNTIYNQIWHGLYFVFIYILNIKSEDNPNNSYLQIDYVLYKSDFHFFIRMISHRFFNLSCFLFFLYSLTYQFLVFLRMFRFGSTYFMTLLTLIIILILKSIESCLFIIELDLLWIGSDWHIYNRGVIVIKSCKKYWSRKLLIFRI